MTIDMPEDLLDRAKIAAVQRKTTLGELVVAGLESILRPAGDADVAEAALRRLQRGFKLGGQPLTREQAHKR